MFSVVIPLWNKRHTVVDTVASVLAQSWRDFELIIVDDGSTDGGMERLNAFDDPRIRRVAQGNAGPGAARNRGVELARHDWVAFLDADDVWLPDHLAELNRIRLAHPEAGLIAAGFVACDRSGRYRSADLDGGSIATVSVLERFGRGESIFCTSSSAIPKSSYSLLGGFGDAPAGQDREYWLRIGLDRSVAISTRVTVVYRRWTGGITDTFQSHWRGGELRDVRDLGPAVAMLADRYPHVRSAALRTEIDAYIDADFSARIRQAARVGDFRSLRSVRKPFLRTPKALDRVLLSVSLLPRPLARAFYAACVGLNAYLNRRRGRLKSRGRSWSEGRISGVEWEHLTTRAPTRAPEARESYPEPAVLGPITVEAEC